MTDTSNDFRATEVPQPTLEELREQYKAEAENTGKALMMAISAYAEAIKKEQGLSQWMNGFDVGWKTAAEHFGKQIEALQTQLQQSEARARQLTMPGFLGVAGVCARWPDNTRLRFSRFGQHGLAE